MAGLDVALAVVGLTSQLFVSAIDCYRFICTAQNLKKDASIHFWKLRIQEIRLQNWGRNWHADQQGFDAFLEEENLVDDVRGLLTQIQDLIGDSTKLKEKYGFKIEGFAEDFAENKHAVARLPSSKHANKPNWAHKFLWSLKDKEKFASLVDDLKELNDGLYCLLGARERTALGNCTESAVLRMTDDATECCDIRQACIAYKENSTKQLGNFQKWLEAPYIDLIDATGAKMLAIVQSQSILPALGVEFRVNTDNQHERDPKAVQGYMKQSPSGVRLIAEFEDNPVLLEWKPVEDRNRYQPLIAQRVENLASLLAPESPKPSDFRVLSCLGYFQDKDRSRYGYLFELPPHVVCQPPVNLHDILSRGGSHEWLPDLGDRFVLARNLAASLLRLHECGWVHASFRSENVIFFHSSSSQLQTNSQLMLTSPYITGFSYSKPADPAESTAEYSLPNRLHDLYRHPEVVASRGNTYQSHHVRLQQRHDLFAFGVVLLEIGLWEQAKALWKEKYTQMQFLEKLMTAYVPRLGHKMGRKYCDVVRDLLSVKSERLEKIPAHAPFRPIVNAKANIQDNMRDGKDVDDLNWWSVVMRLEQCRA